MKLEIGKRYITRDGRTTTPLEASDGGQPFACKVGSGGRCSFNEDGSFWRTYGAESHVDLVAEYNESRIGNPASSDVPYETYNKIVTDLNNANEKYCDRITNLESLVDEKENRICDMRELYHKRKEEQQSRITSLESRLTNVLTMITENGFEFCETSEVPVLLDAARAVSFKLPESYAADEPFILQDDSIESWLAKLPAGYRELALKNYAAHEKRRDFVHQADDQFMALYFAFRWRDTPEGLEFWQQVSRCIDSTNNWPTLPTLNA